MDLHREWGYGEGYGVDPEHWTELAPAGEGIHQSPIDVVAKDAVFEQCLIDRPLRWSYRPTDAQKLTNSGHSAQVSYDGNGSCLQGGPLQYKYQIKQFHMHWGKTDDHGSEHRINGKTCAAELHIVHWNSELYPSFTDAAQSPNGLCVLGVFVMPGKEHRELKYMTDLLKKVECSDEAVDIPHGIDPAALLPDNKTDYFTYPGSLTTPPLFESVTWVLFKDYIELSEDQLEHLRNLHLLKCNGCKNRRLSQVQMSHKEFHPHMCDNFRPVQPLNDRVVKASFRTQ